MAVLAFIFGYVANDLNEARQAETDSRVQECLERALSRQHRDTSAQDAVKQRIAACIEFIEP